MQPEIVMDKITLQDLLNDPQALTTAQILARRERARAVHAVLGSFAAAIKDGWKHLLPPRPSTGRRAAHCG